MKLSIHRTLEKVLKDYRNTSYVDDTDVYITDPTVMPRNESQKIEVYHCLPEFSSKLRISVKDLKWSILRKWSSSALHLRCLTGF